MIGFSYVLNFISKTTNGGVSWEGLLFVENTIKDIFFLTPDYGFICGENAMLVTSLMVELLGQGKVLFIMSYYLLML